MSPGMSSHFSRCIFCGSSFDARYQYLNFSTDFFGFRVLEMSEVFSHFDRIIISKYSLKFRQNPHLKWLAYYNPRIIIHQLRYIFFCITIAFFMNYSGLRNFKDSYLKIRSISVRSLKLFKFVVRNSCVTTNFVRWDPLSIKIAKDGLLYN